MADTPLYSALIDWLTANPDLIALCIAVIAFAESLAVVGVLLPGVMLLAAASFVAGSGALSLPVTVASAWFGAVLGDGVSFLIGRYFHGAIRNLRPFADHPDWINNAERLFQRYGWLSIVIGRFVGPIRPIIPMVAGALDMNSSLFFGINATSALAWAPVYVLPGYLLGANIENQFSSTPLILGLTALLAIAIGATTISRKLLRDRS